MRRWERRENQEVGHPAVCRCPAGGHGTRASLHPYLEGGMGGRGPFFCAQWFSDLRNPRVDFASPLGELVLLRIHPRGRRRNRMKSLQAFARELVISP
jgi:hypothetical protein